MRTQSSLFANFLALILAVLLPMWGCGRLAAAEPNRPIDYSRDIRPLLSDNCFRCHGPDESNREADLRLDTKKGLTQDLGGYSAVAPGDPEGSELVNRIFSSDVDLVMPPPESNKSLSPDERELLKKWIDQGAEWQQHWSFLAPHEPKVPAQVASEGRKWARNEIDQFVLQRLAQAGLEPSLDADAATLVRRLYLDLIGLPPTPEESQHWTQQLEHAADSSSHEDAYQRLVTTLLDSEHYGERWARKWLDLARYADTNGYEKDRDRTIWPYRDWVVRALNSDMPFDQFTIEQLAGDMLPDATLDQRIATGFHRNTMLNEEGGIDPLEFRFHAVTDRIATTGTTWLGLTIGCCQCHTHKYDPITHTEYFQLMAFLNNSDEPELELPDPSVDAQWKRNLEQADEQLRHLSSHWPLPNTPDEAEIKTETEAASARAAAIEAAFATWLAGERANNAAWETLMPVLATANLPTLTIEADGSIFASGDTAKRDDYAIELAPASQPTTSIMLEALPDRRLPAGGPGSTYYEGTRGDFYLTEIDISTDSKPIEISAASASFSQNRFGKNPSTADLAIDGDIQTGWSVHGRQGERHVAIFNLAEPIPANTLIRIHMSFGRHFASSLGRFRFAATSAAHAPQARDYSPETGRLLLLEDSQLAPEQRVALENTFLLQAEELSSQAAKIVELRKRPQALSTLVISERPSESPRTTHRHHRGEYLQPEEPVVADVPAVLPSMDGFEPNRLGFARWLVAPQNPLTARVTVNRAWGTFFATGLVKTVDDFGLQGESPSHPELLDWLALRFSRTDRWSLKSLHRRIVSSSTYRQSSRVHDNALRVDPDNRLLAYFPRTRLDAEILRDSWLVAAGKLNPTLGGPPVRPPQPAGVTEVAYGNPKWQPSQGSDRFRRSLYTFSKRTAPYAMFATFDAPSGEACLARRERSNSPLQALTLLNDVMVMELGAAAGKRMAGVKGTRAERMELLFRSVLVRRPTADEQAALLDFYARQLDHLALDAQAAAKLLEETEALEPNSLSATYRMADQAAWAATARAVFSLDEAQTRE